MGSKSRARKLNLYMLVPFDKCIASAREYSASYITAEKHSEQLFDVAYEYTSMLIYISYKTKYNSQFSRPDRLVAIKAQSYLRDLLDQLLEARMEKLKLYLDLGADLTLPQVTDPSLAGIGGMNYPELISPLELDGAIEIDDKQLEINDSTVTSVTAFAGITSVEMPAFIDPLAQAALVRSGYPERLRI